MSDAPWGLALTAGLLAAVNPCGFALLPAYLSFLIVGDAAAATGAVSASGAGHGGTGDGDGDGSPDGSPGAVAGGPTRTRRLAAVSRALSLTAAMTLGFVLVFGTFGLLAGPVARTVGANLPWASIVIGLSLAAIGGWLLAGRRLPTVTLFIGRRPVTHGLGSMTLFGISYAVASLGCTIGPFLAVVVSAFRAESVLTGIGLFVAYAGGMALLIGTVALAIALARVSVVRGLRRAGALLTRLSGVLLIGAGLYVAWYGWYEIRVFEDPTTTDPVITAGARIQATLSSWVNGIGPGSLAVVVATLAVAVLAVAAVRRYRRP